MLSRSMMIFVAVTMLALGLAAGAAGAQPNASLLWSDVSPAAIAPAGERLITPDHYRALSMDIDATRAFLAQAPLESTAEALNRPVIELPLPDGGSERFAFVESPVMAPELQARYPEIRTYAGYGLDDPSATARFDLTPQGFHALILSDDGSIYIDPFQRGDVAHYQSYYRRDLISVKSLGGCTVVDTDGMGEEIHRLVQNEVPLVGTQLRTYRAAVACTGEYATFQGGTVALALAAIVTSMNRVDGVYQREVSIFMQLIPNETAIIYTNASTDPYSNSDGATMLGQNQANLDSVIGSANYDIGHVFSTGGGGIAGLGVVCRAGRKAQGVTGSPAPVGDAYDIDYVAHEMGHQFGANHTFNSTAGACGGGNRNAGTAYESGSASTIMGYAGICGAQDDLQPHSDDYFVWISIQEIVAYSTSGAGNGCPVTTATGVVEPVANAGPSGFTIPLRTPFTLTASANTTGAPTYCWEESDLGTAGHPDSPSGNAPIFRSFHGVASPSRTFPKQSDLLNNVHTKGELLPTYARNLSFKVTVRDTQTGGVGVALTGMSFAVASVGPFLVTYPNTAVTWTGLTQQTVTWDVAGTNAAPVNCQNVNVLLSTDGGVTFPTVLVAATPNDGSETITVPNTPTTTARIKVEAADNVFFDISNTNFVIEQQQAGVAAPELASSGMALYASRPNPFNPKTMIRFDMPQEGQAALRIYDPAGRLVRTLVDGTMAAGSHQASWDGTDAGGRAVSSGMYLYKLSARGETLTQRMLLLK